MKSHRISRTRGFTLLETVIAIGVLAVLLTGFMVVFAPAAEGIRKSINVQEADRLVSTLERELVTKRQDDKTFTEFQEPSVFATGFDKAFYFLRNSDKEKAALIVYQYRGKTSGSLRSDGTPEPQPVLKDNLPGKDYIVVPMVRRKGDPLLLEDLKAIEGGLYLVKATQLVFEGNELKLGKAGEIKNPKPNTNPPDPNYKPGPFNDPVDYPEAVIAFSADFYTLPAKTADFVKSGAFTARFTNARNPVFTRNLAVRR